MLEAARVSQAGYPKRIPFRDFIGFFMGAHALPRALAERLSDDEKRRLVRAVAVRVLRLPWDEAKQESTSFALGRSKIFLRRGVWEVCVRRQRLLLEKIGTPPSRIGEHKIAATGVRNWRLKRRLHELVSIAQASLQDKAKREKLREEIRLREEAERQRREDAEHAREEQVQRMIEAKEKEAAAAEKVQVLPILVLPCPPRPHPPLAFSSASTLGVPILVLPRPPLLPWPPLLTPPFAAPPHPSLVSLGLPSSPLPWPPHLTTPSASPPHPGLPSSTPLDRPRAGAPRREPRGRNGGRAAAQRGARAAYARGAAEQAGARSDQAARVRPPEDR